jgi:hypothetical protein
VTYDEYIDEFAALPPEPPAWYDDAQPSFEELCRQQGVTPISLGELLATRPFCTPEEAEAFARAMEELRKERW